MSTEAMSKDALYWLADCTGLSLQGMKTKVTGTGKLRIPLVNKQRLVCHLAVVASKNFKSDGMAAILIHVRWDLYLYIELNTGFKCAMMWALNAPKIESKMVDLFKHCRKPDAVIKKFSEGIVGTWGWDKTKWIKDPYDADRVGG